MPDAVRRHDTIVRTEVERKRGHVFKTIGDAFCVAFDRPEDAVDAAVGVRGALEAADFDDVGGLRIRIAIHCGTTHERDGDYFGPSVNRVARLLATGHGGQLLVSGIVAQLVRDRLAPGLRVVDLGTHRLKDLARAEQIFQIDAGASQTAFPPLRTLSALANNLPTTLTSFVGREREVADLGQLLAEKRIVTILGSGGIGKTRISAQVAAQQLDRYADGIWFVELAPLSDGAFIPNTIARLVGIELAPGNEAMSSLVTALRGKRMLFVLDNCEHVIDAAARVAAALASGCPDLSILATSRQPLSIAGEHAYRMPTLSAPSAVETKAMTARSALAFDSVRLFEERAKARNSSFEITDDTAPIIGEICRRLDGIALAIELAAARVHVLAPAQLRDRLDARLKILAVPNRDLPQRQQTLRALIAWSVDLLDPSEQRLFARLGIFADGFTLEAVCAVCEDAGTGELDTFELLASLADKSLVVAEVDRDPTRYRLLDSMRSYALMKLDEGAERDVLAARHLRYFAELVAEGEREYDRTRSDRALVSLGSEHDNVRAALAWASAGGDAPSGATLLVASRQLWRRWSASAEGIERCDRAATTDAFDAATKARLLSVASFLAYKTGRTVMALDCAERAVPLALESGQATIVFDALLCRALPLMFAGRVDEAETDLAAAQAALGRAEGGVSRVRLVEARGILKSWREDYVEGAAAFAELVRLHRADNNVEGAVHASCNLAECEHARGQTDRAISVLRDALPHAAALGHVWHAYLLANLAGYLAAVSAIAEAGTAARSAIELSTADPAAPLVANALEHYALTLALDGDLERAARLVGYCDATRSANAFRRQHTESLTHDRLMSLLGAQMTPAQLAGMLETGALFSAADAVETALLAERSP